MILTMMLSSIGVFAAETSKPTFTDVDANSISGQAIYKLVNAGVLNGYSDGTFKPNNPLTRAELCKIVNLVFGYTEAATDTFTDVSKSDWFYNYVAVAKKAGYITGHADGTFKGNDYLTREQACAIITRVTELFDLSMTETITDEVSSWAIPYVNKVVSNRLMSLEAGGKFRATENITRGELTSVMAVFVDAEEKPLDKTEVFTVSFNTNGGNSIDSIKVDSGKTVKEPASPTKKGYTFDGWYSDTNLTKSFDFASLITADITLYAKWEKSSAGGGGGGGSSPSTPSKPQVPEIDEEKQAQAIKSLESMLKVLNEEANFSVEKGEMAVINPVKEAIQNVLADAKKNVAIYEGDYINKTYGYKIDEALDAYDAMTDENKGGFQSKLLKLKKEHFDEANELSKLLFGLPIDKIEDIINEKLEEEQ